MPRSCSAALLAVVLVTLTSQAASAPPYKTAEEAHNAGRKLIREGSLADAREPLETALTLTPTAAQRLDINRTLITVYRELKEIEPMQKAVEYVIANTNRAAERTLARGALLSFINKRGRMANALVDYEARLKKNPEDAIALFIVGEAYATYKNDAEKSVAAFEKLAEVEKKNGRDLDAASQSQLAQQCVKAGKAKAGAEHFERLAARDATTEAWNYKEAAAAWLKAGDKEKAIAAADRALAAVPEKRSDQLRHFWHRGLADVYLGAGQPKKAIPHYEQAAATTKIEGYVKECQKKLAEAKAAAEK